MDAVLELVKSVITLVGLFVVLILIPILFVLIFSIGASLDERLNR